MRLSVLLLLLTACDPAAKDTGADDTAADTGDLDTGDTDTDTGEAVDADDDGYPVGEDCDDESAAVNPGATEACDGIDNDCDDDVDEDVLVSGWVDGDGDGYGADGDPLVGCELPAGYVANADDCDDARADVNPAAQEDDCADPTDYNCDGSVGYADADADGTAACQDCDDARADVFPGADEVCDGADNDCDTEIDDEAIDRGTYYADADADGYGDTDAATLACDLPVGYAAEGGDCDDADAAFHPAALEEDCTDPADYNCDGSVGYADADADGTAACEDCDDADPTVNPGAVELCNDVDDDCDLTVDEDDALDATTWYLDVDADGFGGTGGTAVACDVPAGYAATADDCDDASAAAFPGAAESCNDVDDDCDTVVDEPDAVDAATWYADVDADTFGDAAAATVACDAPAAHVADATDCDDTRATDFPGAVETCDDFDNDCDLTVDEPDAADAADWFADADGDTFGDADVGTVACDAPAGFVSDASDCDDARATDFPGADERCDTFDNDCDGSVDEASAVDAPTWYADVDADGFGADAVTDVACAQPTGFVADAGDCDDALAAIHPAAAEVCDDVDNDCDTVIDTDATDRATWYADADGDTFGDAATTALACDMPAGFVADATDCSDAAATSYPGAPELCDSVDNDCDSAVDDGAGDTFYADADGDGYGVDGTTQIACAAPAGYAAAGGDCDDALVAINPGATEVCENGIDENCSAEPDCELSGDNVVADADLAIVGATQNEGVGASFGMGDVNGDGQDDLLVGHLYDASSSKSNTGRVHVWYGPLDGTEALANDDLMFDASTLSSGDGFGYTTTAVGDMDGDGAEEFVVGAYVYNTSSATDIGQAWLYDQPTADGTQSNAESAFVGVAARDYMGWGIAGAGDQDGDGLGDLVVSAYGYDGGATDGGAVGLWHGGDIGASETIATASVLFRGTTASGAFGTSVASGDLDGDGTNDIVVGAPGSSSSEGAVYVFLGGFGTDGTVDDTAADVVFTGTAASHFGVTVAVLGDATGDGATDLAVGADYDDGGIAEGGAVYVFSSFAASASASTAHFVVQGENGYDYLGRTLSEAGDTNGDGVADLWFGATGYDLPASGAGLATLVMGPLPSGTYLRSVAADGEWTGTGSNDALGYAMGGGRDLDGDGYADLAVGAPASDSSTTTNVGGAWVLFGSGE